jgi:hypothetical protein
MNAQKQAELIVRVARPSERDSFKSNLPRIWGEHRPRRKNADSGWAGMTDGFT